jgi:acyl-CoA oxidase
VFVPCLQGQASDAQLEAWLPKAQSKQWIGAYVQTEAAHGSNVAQLQTTFTYHTRDNAADELVVHTPNLGAIKWWPGCLGKTATHAVTFGRLIVVNGSSKSSSSNNTRTDHGVHCFLVQLRSLETHKPLRGIEVGDIGPKYGTNANDNGFVRFTHVRIPRTNMCMRHSTLARNGAYTKPQHSKLSYGTMVGVRSSIVLSSFMYLAKACTIAIRYSAQRRQFNGDKQQLEMPVLDYTSQQYRLLPRLAQAFAFRFTGEAMFRLYAKLRMGLATGDVSALPVVHATSAGLKSYISSEVGSGIDECRKTCGGHGYLRTSGMPDLYADY